MENFRKQFLKGHGMLLVLLGVAFATATLLGRFKNAGPLAFLNANPQAAVGLFEAYLLVAICGAFLWLGSNQTDVRKWNRMGALIHVALATTNITFWPFYAQVDMETMGIVSTAGHFIIIAVESFLGFSKK